MLTLHVHDRWSALGGADWHLISVLDNLPAGVDAAGVFGRSDDSVEPGHEPRRGLNFIRKLDLKAPFAAERKTAAELEAFIRKTGPDLVHVHNILNPVLMEAAAACGRAVITVQDHRFFCPGRGKVREDGSLCNETFGLHCAGCFDEEKYFLRLMELVRARLKALESFRAIVVLSRYMKQELIRAGLPEDRIEVIPPFVHDMDLTESPAAFGRDILFAGRLVWAKGVFDILEALSLLDSSARLVVAGAGTIEDQVAERVRELKLENRIDFLGWTPHRDMAGIYRRARVVALPSRWQEPFGIVGLEAHALGRPVVAYDVGGVREWLKDGETGVIVPAGNVLALTAGLQVLLRESETAEELGRAGRERVEMLFDRNELMNRLVGVYEKASV